MQQVHPQNTGWEILWLSKNTEKKSNLEKKKYQNLKHSQGSELNPEMAHMLCSYGFISVYMLSWKWKCMPINYWIEHTLNTFRLLLYYNQCPQLKIHYNMLGKLFLSETMF